LILQRQIEQRGERRKCLDADIRLSCQKLGVRACRPVEHPGRHFKPPICLRLFQRAAEDDKTILVDGTMNANSATKPWMMPIKNFAKNGLVGVLKPRCTTMCGLIRGSAGWRPRSMPQTSYRNRAKALRSLRAPRLGPLLRLCKMATARLSVQLDKSWGQRHRLNNHFLPPNCQ
jgi:hypothetical protein